MKRLFDYLRLRSQGFSVRKSWELSRVVAFNMVDRALATILLLSVICAAAIYLDAKLSAKYYEYYYSAIAHKKQSEQYKTQYEKYEKVVLGCLANQGIIINRVNYECLIRPYRERL